MNCTRCNQPVTDPYGLCDNCGYKNKVPGAAPAPSQPDTSDTPTNQSTPPDKPRQPNNRKRSRSLSEYLRALPLAVKVAGIAVAALLIIVALVLQVPAPGDVTTYSAAKTSPTLDALPTPTEPVATATQAATAEPTQTPTAPPISVSFGQLKQGMVSDEVKAMQLQLITLGYLSGNADGDFGAATKKAVEAFQGQNGLEADGIAGNQTLLLLYGGNAQYAGTAAVQDSTPAAATGTPVAITRASPTASATEKPAATEKTSKMVWIPTKGGQKYHINKTCSGMLEPAYITLEDAESRGFTACKSCN